MCNALKMEREDLLEARDYDLKNVQEAKEEQAQCKVEYDKIYAEKKDC